MLPLRITLGRYFLLNPKLPAWRWASANVCMGLRCRFSHRWIEAGWNLPIRYELINWRNRTVLWQWLRCWVECRGVTSDALFFFFLKTMYFIHSFYLHKCIKVPACSLCFLFFFRSLTVGACSGESFHVRHWQWYYRCLIILSNLCCISWWCPFVFFYFIFFCCLRVFVIGKVGLKDSAADGAWWMLARPWTSLVCNQVVGIGIFFGIFLLWRGGGLIFVSDFFFFCCPFVAARWRRRFFNRTQRKSVVILYHSRKQYPFKFVYQEQLKQFEPVGYRKRTLNCDQGYLLFFLSILWYARNRFPLSMPLIMINYFTLFSRLLLLHLLGSEQITRDVNRTRETGVPSIFHTCDD